MNMPAQFTILDIVVHFMIGVINLFIIWCSYHIFFYQYSFYQCITSLNSISAVHIFIIVPFAYLSGLALPTPFWLYLGKTNKKRRRIHKIFIYKDGLDERIVDNLKNNNLLISLVKKSMRSKFSIDMDSSNLENSDKYAMFDIVVRFVNNNASPEGIHYIKRHFFLYNCFVKLFATSILATVFLIICILKVWLMGSNPGFLIVAFVFSLSCSAICDYFVQRDFSTWSESVWKLFVAMTLPVDGDRTTLAKSRARRPCVKK